MERLGETGLERGHGQRRDRMDSDESICSRVSRACAPRRPRAGDGVGARGALMGVRLLLLLGLSGTFARAQTTSASTEPLRVLTPLYARPGGDFWTHMVDAALNTTVGYSVVINPNSGPGDAAETVYTDGINDLLDAGVEVLCYVATGFGLTNISDVTADIDLYEVFYPGLCGGFFFDEGPGTDDNAWKYTEYYSYVQEVSATKDATVVVNPGRRPHQSLYNIGDAYSAANPGLGGQVVIVSFENNYVVFDDGRQDYENRQVPFPPRYVHDRYMHSVLVYGAYFTDLSEFLDFTVFQLYCENWGYVFFTDDSIGDDGNPWDDTPGYFVALLDAVAKAEASADLCGTYAPTGAPTIAPTLSPLAPGETRPPLPTPSPTVLTTLQPAAIGQTRAPVVPLPTPAPTKAPTLSPTPAPTLAPTTPAPSPAPTEAPVPASELDDSGAWRSAIPPSIALPLAAVLVSALCSV